MHVATESSQGTNAAKEAGKGKKNERKKVLKGSWILCVATEETSAGKMQKSTRTSRQTFTTQEAPTQGRLLAEREFLQGCRVQEVLGETQLLLKPQSLYKPLCRVMKTFLFALLAFYAQAFISQALGFTAALCSVLMIGYFFLCVCEH